MDQLVIDSPPNQRGQKKIGILKMNNSSDRGDEIIHVCNIEQYNYYKTRLDT